MVILAEAILFFRDFYIEVYHMSYKENTNYGLQVIFSDEETKRVIGNSG